jgi:hypothetical protein
MPQTYGVRIASLTAVAATGPSGSSRGSLEINNGPLAASSVIVVGESVGKAGVARKGGEG